jgi:hypothetical protein
MCAETVPWRCHRSLVADALAIPGIPVVEMLSATNSPPVSKVYRSPIRPSRRACSNFDLVRWKERLCLSRGRFEIDVV